jgi:hypothetical protein
MNASDLDQTYRTLARAIDQSAGNQIGNAPNLMQSKHEVFLAMLSLKLITQLANADVAQTIISEVLAESLKPNAQETLNQQRLKPI